MKFKVDFDLKIGNYVGPTVNTEQYVPAPGIVVPALNAPLHTPRHFVVPHVQFGRVQKPFKFEPTCVAIRYHITHLTDDCGENEDPYEVTGDGEDVPANID